MSSLSYNKQMPKAEQIREKKILCEFLIEIGARNFQCKATFSLNALT